MERFEKARILAILGEWASTGTTAASIASKYRITRMTLYRWRDRFGPQAPRARGPRGARPTPGLRPSRKGLDRRIHILVLEHSEKLATTIGAAVRTHLERLANDIALTVRQDLAQNLLTSLDRPRTGS